MPPRRQKSVRVLRSYDDAIELLGGTGSAAERLNRTPTQICQWRTRNNSLFPAELWFAVNKLLEPKGYHAPKGMFAFEGNKPRRTRRS